MRSTSIAIIGGLVLASTTLVSSGAQEIRTPSGKPSVIDAPVPTPLTPSPAELNLLKPATTPEKPKTGPVGSGQPGNLPTDLPSKPIIPAPTRPVPPSEGIQRVNATSTATSANQSIKAALLKNPDLTPMQKQMLQATGRGTDWLVKMNGTSGQFLAGIVPALRVQLEEDNFLHQAGAAFGLARAARFSGDEMQLAVATHSILPLIDQTIKDKELPIRYPSSPSIVVNRVGAASLIILAINELPNPKKDLVEPSEEMCEFIRRQVMENGSIACGDRQADGKFGPEEADAQTVYPPLALYAIIRSHVQRPAPWKLDLVRKSTAYYLTKWRKSPNLKSISPLTAACAEAYLVTKEKTFADAVFEMNDWLCSMQYGEQDTRQPLWIGGFMACIDGKPARTPPTISSAEYGESLAQACKVARSAVDVKRHERYTHSVERCLQFLTTLQYVEATTQHFEETYRKRLSGGFHASHQDGNLRIDYSQHALSAMVLYLEQIK